MFIIIWVVIVYCIFVFFDMLRLVILCLEIIIDGLVIILFEFLLSLIIWNERRKFWFFLFWLYILGCDSVILILCGVLFVLGILNGLLLFNRWYVFVLFLFSFKFELNWEIWWMFLFVFLIFLSILIEYVLFWVCGMIVNDVLKVENKVVIFVSVVLGWCFIGFNVVLK